ncbi:hypothetical protein R1flu_012635 [Riccia fluitans]|uniref:Uncharacterized protein n=1 Tax=Riccia fluitans TaxID=41844 RepID=A0ABD1ZCB5_9MARC
MAIGNEPGTSLLATRKKRFSSLVDSRWNQSLGIHTLTIVRIMILPTKTFYMLAEDTRLSGIYPNFAYSTKTKMLNDPEVQGQGIPTYVVPFTDPSKAQADQTALSLP